MEKIRDGKKKILLGSMIILLIMIVCAATASAKTVRKTEKKTLYYGQSITLKFSEKASWKTSNKKIVSVKPRKNGKSAVLKAKKAGKVTVTVKQKNAVIRYVITVKNNILSKTSLAISEGERTLLGVNGKTGTMKIKVSNPAIASAKVYSGRKISITGKKAGQTKVIITENGKTLKCLVTVKGKSVPISTSQQESTKQDNKVKYSYEVCFFSQPYAGTVNTPVFIKTNAPGTGKERFSLALYDTSGNKVSFSYAFSEYDDMEHQDNLSSLIRVDGGYVATLELKKAGTYTVKISEYTYPYSDAETASVSLGRIKVLDEASEKQEWIRTIISKATTPAMTKPEKMKAICDYLYDHSKYLKNYIDVNGQLHYMSLIVDEGVPDWIRGEWSSYTSPKLLEEFGEEIDYKVKSLYSEYLAGSEEWYQYHYCARAVDDGLLYSFCHVSETNCYTDIHTTDDIPKIDFVNYQGYFLRIS